MYGLSMSNLEIITNETEWAVVFGNGEYEHAGNTAECAVELIEEHRLDPHYNAEYMEPMTIVSRRRVESVTKWAPQSA